MTMLSNRLSTLRKECGLTQKETAEKLGVNTSTYVGWEKEGKMPDAANIYKIADMYKVSCDYLLGYSDYKVNSQNVLSHSNDHFTTIFNSLPISSKEATAELLSKIFDFLAEDAKKQDTERIKLYSSFIDVLSRSRTAIQKSASDNDTLELITRLSEAKKAFSDMIDTIAEFEIKAKR